MAAESTPALVQLVPLDRIRIEGERRALDPAKVAALAASIEQIGLLHPVTLAPDGRLVAGLHRLEAWRRLQRSAIPALVLDGAAVQSGRRELATLDENLIRHDLTPLEQGQWARRRDELLTALGLRAPSGGTGANQYQSRGETVSPLPKTTAQVAAEVGLSERSLQQRLQIATQVAPDVQATLLADPALRPIVESTTDLLLLARMEAPHQRIIVEKAQTLAAQSGAGDGVSAEVGIKEAQRALLAEQRAARAANVADVPEGRYRCLVIDPPWPVDKILRDVRPNQDLFDYATMTVEEITATNIPGLADPAGCHIYLWHPHRFLREALACFDAWGVRYQCQFTWIKPGGPTPFSWMYNTEHVLFGRVGTLPLLQNGLKLSFEAPAAGHSVKPDAFYERVRLASPAPRLELFARRRREGFAVWGNEAPA